MKLKKIKFREKSKSERLIYVVIFLWIVFGIFGIYNQISLPAFAGYYTSLILFVGTYLWGENKRLSLDTKILKKGHNSPREVIIYITVLLWVILGIYGIIKKNDINDLTVYFAALSPFVSSFIIYRTTKGKDLPIFNKDTQDQQSEVTDKAKLITEQVGNIVDKVENVVEEVKDKISGDKESE